MVEINNDSKYDVKFSIRSLAGQDSPDSRKRIKAKVSAIHRAEFPTERNELLEFAMYCKEIADQKVKLFANIHYQTEKAMKKAWGLKWRLAITKLEIIEGKGQTITSQSGVSKESISDSESGKSKSTTAPAPAPKKAKSIPLAIILAFLFGPFGLLYCSKKTAGIILFIMFACAAVAGYSTPDGFVDSTCMIIFFLLYPYGIFKAYRIASASKRNETD